MPFDEKLDPLQHHLVHQSPMFFQVLRFLQGKFTVARLARKSAAHLPPCNPRSHTGNRTQKSEHVCATGMSRGSKIVTDDDTRHERRREREVFHQILSKTPRGGTLRCAATPFGQADPALVVTAAKHHHVPVVVIEVEAKRAVWAVISRPEKRVLGCGLPLLRAAGVLKRKLRGDDAPIVHAGQIA